MYNRLISRKSSSDLLSSLHTFKVLNLNFAMTVWNSKRQFSDNRRIKRTLKQPKRIQKTKEPLELQRKINDPYPQVFQPDGGSPSFISIPYLTGAGSRSPLGWRPHQGLDEIASRRKCLING
ncbi:hypothetical protein CEXT_759471 [Caerostris extrusa]|uniref:Ribosomal protein S18 n=1 Tax=Caerostris extrusa TaxID=172846 RepID=A0AAV4Y056_CAEEX|nr:hypothetical protein CEXT_759471 [Caerostris extrusa]